MKKLVKKINLITGGFFYTGSICEDDFVKLANTLGIHQDNFTLDDIYSNDDETIMIQRSSGVSCVKSKRNSVELILTDLEYSF